MKGTDLSQWQLDAAAEFIMSRNPTPPKKPLADDAMIGMRWADFVRMVAWYGAIRAQATREGIDPDKPGMTFVERSEDDGPKAKNESPAADPWSPFAKH